MYQEARKYKKEDIYQCELKEAVKETKKRCKDEVIFIVRKFLCVSRCNKRAERVSMKLIEIKNVSYRYSNKDNILENVNLTIKKGEFVSIIGKNGSGKSTLARIMAGITKPSCGEITICGINIKEKKQFLELRKKIRDCFSKPRKPDYF